MMRKPCQIVLADMVVMRRRLALEVSYQSIVRRLGHNCCGIGQAFDYVLQILGQVATYLIVLTQFFNS